MLFSYKIRTYRMLIATDGVKDKCDKGKVGTPWVRRSAAKQLKISCRQVEEAKPFTPVQLQLSEHSKRTSASTQGPTNMIKWFSSTFIQKEKLIYNVAIDLETYRIHSLSGHRILLNPGSRRAKALCIKTSSIVMRS